MASRAIRGELAGLKEALRALDALGKAARNKALRPALNEASQLVLSAARTLVPVGATGMLKKSLAKKVVTLKAGAGVAGVVGPATGTTRGRRVAGKRTRRLTAFGKRAQLLGVKPAKYAHLVEEGHRMVGHRPLRKEIGRVAAKPFLRPAFERSKDQAVAVIARRVAEELRKAVRAA